MHCCTQCPPPCSRLPPTYASAGDSWTLRASLGQSPVGSLLLFPRSWCAQGFVCALQESVSPVLCKFWWLCGEDNGDLLQEGLCHTQVCCTQSPCCPWSAGHCQPMPLQETPGHSQASWVSLLWRPCSFLLGPGVHKVLFVPSKSLFPQPCVSSIIKPHCSSKSNSLEVLSPFARSPGWEISCES